jgi:protein dithiol oxidoreductase (disulfide-forming)
MKRRFLTLAMAVGLVSAGWVVSGIEGAAADEFTQDKEYFLVKQPMRATDDQSKLEVVELFWYGCPHCFDFEPTVEKWSKQVPADVTFVRVPAIFSPVWEFHAKAFYTFEALGILEKVHRPFFDAWHVAHRQIKDADALAEFLKDHGVDKASFDNAFNSFGVDAKVRKAKQLMQAYGVEGVPALAVNGKYRTSLSDAHGPDAAFKVVEFLLQKERPAK